MVRLVTEERIPSLERLCEGSSFGCKTAGLQQAYSLLLPFVRFRVQAHEQGEVAAAASLPDGTVVLHLRSTTGRDELREFLSVAGCRILPCEESAAYALYGASNRAGETFAYSLVMEQSMTENGVELLDEVPVHELFPLLCEYGGQKAEQFEPFYLGVSHCMRHRMCLTQDAIFSGRPAACAMAGGVTETDAVLSAVVTHLDLRRRGLGGAVIQVLLLCLLPKTVYVLCENEQAGLFYRSLTLSSAGRWAELDF